MQAHRLTPLAALALALVTQGCETDVGVCDPDMASQLAYQGGVPGFTGQVILTNSCAGGYCHYSQTADEELENRLGAPRGLDFELTPFVGPRLDDPTAEETRTRELLARHRRVFDMRGHIWAQVQARTMPPWDWNQPLPEDPDDDTLLEAAQRQATLEDFEVVVDEETGERAPVPTLETEEGREILRNWLACDAPIVERTQGSAIGESSYVVPECEQTCVGPTWSAILEGILTPRCATSGCHNESAAGALSMVGTPEQILGRMVDVPADGSQCESGATEDPMPAQGMLRITPGDPTESLLIQKVVRPSSEICGGVMPASGAPLSEQRLCVLREWVACGACGSLEGMENMACRDCLMDADLLARCNLPADYFAEADPPAIVECAETPPCTPSHPITPP